MKISAKRLIRNLAAAAVIITVSLVGVSQSGIFRLAAELHLPVASNTAVTRNQHVLIDHSNAHDGYVMIRFLTPTNMTVAVLITGPDAVQYSYRLRGDGEFEVFPLTAGDGSYLIQVLENIEAGTNRFSLRGSATIDVTLTSEFAPFLRPNQFVNFNAYSEVVRVAAELICADMSIVEKIAAVYYFVITNIDYDVELARTVQSGYVPDLDEVLARGKGICFDYASLMAAMLRSQGIPARLAIGYVGLGNQEVYHAWIDVYSEEEGWLNAVVFFDGETWRLLDPTFSAGGAPPEFVGDGSNYRVVYFH